MNTLTKKIHLSENTTNILNKYNECHNKTLLEMAIDEAVREEKYEKASLLLTAMIQREQDRNKG